MFILTSAWIITFIILVVFIPRARIREAIVVFLFKQLITWFWGLTVAENRLIEYPVREFPYATKGSFCFEFFIFPSISVIFILYYPFGKSRFKQFQYYFIYTTGMTLLEYFIEKYTKIIDYIHWSWYVTWITLLITFFLSVRFYLWFSKKGVKE